MGSSASVQKEEKLRKDSRQRSDVITAQNVRKRLLDEFGGEEEEVERNQDVNKGLGMAEVPVLLKAKSAFMKNIRREDPHARDDGNIVKKQVTQSDRLESFYFGRATSWQVEMAK